MTRTRIDDDWGLLGRGQPQDVAESRHHSPLRTEEVRAALAAVEATLAPGEHDRVRAILVSAWQNCAHAVAWWQSKASPGESRETLKRIDEAFAAGRYRLARALLARVNEMTATHIEVRSDLRVSFGLSGQRAARFTPLELQRVRVAVRSLVQHPPRELAEAKPGPRGKPFGRAFFAELGNGLSASLGPYRGAGIARALYASLRRTRGFVLSAARDLARPRPKVNRKPARRAPNVRVNRTR